MSSVVRLNRKHGACVTGSLVVITWNVRTTVELRPNKKEQGEEGEEGGAREEGGGVSSTQRKTVHLSL